MVGASMATERAGPLLGALIITLPIGAGPAYFFLALDHPPEFIAASALGSLAVNAANGVFGLVYVALAQRPSVALILQPRVGGAVSAAVIANGLTGLVGFGASLVVLHVAALSLGNAAALTLWLLTSMGWNLCLWALWRRRMVVRPPAARMERSSSPPQA